jgi:hypothetical protein
LVGAPDQGAGSGGPPETKSLAVGRPLGSIQHKEELDPMLYFCLSESDSTFLAGKG